MTILFENCAAETVVEKIRIQGTVLKEFRFS
jgi:hypothetical protein